jgi:hypothetical protein
MKKIVTVAVTRNKAASVKTLHTILRFNILCIERQTLNHVMFVNDDPVSRTNIIKSVLGNCDRIVWLDYSVSISDDQTLLKCIEPFEQGCHGIVFPAVKPGINWDVFKQKVKSDTKTDEPISQYGLEFDTVVHKKIKDDLYSIKDTDPKCWVLDNKSLTKALKNKKGEFQKIPYFMEEFFDYLADKGLKVYAYTDSNLTLTYTHECVGNILNAAGIKAN